MIEESENAQFTNSISFGEEVTLNRGHRGSLGNDACIDKGVANSAEVGDTLENNGQATEGSETSRTNGRENSSGTSTGTTVGAGISAPLGSSGASGSLSFSRSRNSHNEVKDLNSETTGNSKSDSRGWRQAKSRNRSSQRNINTRFCEKSDREESQSKGTTDSKRKEDGTSKGNQVTNRFTVPHYFDSVRNSASFSKAEKHFSRSSGAIARSSRKCASYNLGIQADNPPAFSNEFKKAVQTLHDLTRETKPNRTVVVKIGQNEFNTTLNSETEKRFDSAFSDFIR